MFITKSSSFWVFENTISSPLYGRVKPSLSRQDWQAYTPVGTGFRPCPGRCKAPLPILYVCTYVQYVRNYDHFRIWIVVILSCVVLTLFLFIKTYLFIVFFCEYLRIYGMLSSLIPAFACPPICFYELLQFSSKGHATYCKKG